MLPPLNSDNRKINDLNDCMYGHKTEMHNSTAAKINNDIIHHPFYTSNFKRSNIDIKGNGYFASSSTASVLSTCRRAKDCNSNSTVGQDYTYSNKTNNIFTNNHQIDICNKNFKTAPSLVIPAMTMPFCEAEDIEQSRSKSPESPSMFYDLQGSLSPSDASNSGSEMLSPGSGSACAASENLYLLEQFSSKHVQKYDNGSGSQQYFHKTQEEGGKRQRAKSNYKHVPHKDKPPHLVARRNARERRRVQAVNSAFSKLRKHIPYPNKNKRLSKVKTLKIAIDYIHQLQDMIDDYDNSIIKQTDTYSIHNNYKETAMMSWQDIHQQNYHGGYDSYGYCS